MQDWQKHIGLPCELRQHTVRGREALGGTVTVTVQNTDAAAEWSTLLAARLPDCSSAAVIAAINSSSNRLAVELP